MSIPIPHGSSHSITHFVPRSFLLVPAILLMAGLLAAQKNGDTLTIEQSKGIHSYRIGLPSDQYIHVLVEPRGIIRRERWPGQNGKRGAPVDNPGGPEPMPIVPVASGHYWRDVHLLAKGGPSSCNDDTIEDTRTATRQDKRHHDKRRQKGEADTLYESCKTYIESEDYKNALIYCKPALPLYRKAGDKDGEASTLHTIGLIHLRLGENRQAIIYFEEALPLWRSLSDEESEAATLQNLSAVHNNLSDKQKALQYLNQALQLRRVNKDVKGEANSLSSIGAIYSDLGEYAKALEYLNLALPLSRRAGDRIEEAGIQNNFGDIYLKLGETKEAQLHFEQAELIYKAARNKRGQAVSQSNIGGVYYAMGKNNEALESLNQALLLRREIGDKDGEAATLQNIGSIYFELGEKQKAREVLEKALRLVRSVCNRRGQATILNNIAFIYSELDEHQEAFERFGVALALARLSGDTAGEANTLSNLMAFWEKYENPPLAIFYGKQAVNMLQRMRRLNVTHGIDNELQKSLVLKFQSVYHKLAELLIEHGDLEQAVEVLNLYQDQQSFDLKASNTPLRQIGLTVRENRLAQQYETSNQEIGRTELQIIAIKRCGDRKLTEQETAKLTTLEGEYSRALRVFLAFYNDSRREFAKPRDVEDAAPPVKEVEELRRTLRIVSAETKQNTVALYTLIGADNFRLLLVSPDGIKAFASPVESGEFESKVRQFYALLQSTDYDPRVLGKELYDLVLRAADKDLKKQNVQTLLWSLDGRLRYVPMAALWDGKRYLVERYQNVVFTRSETQRITRNVSREWTGIGFGNSRAHSVDLDKDGKIDVSLDALPGMAEELGGIFKRSPTDKSGILGGEVFTNELFTEAKFYDALQARRPIVHISSHFVFRPGDASQSFLLLGDGKPLTLNEMKSKEALFEKIELLALSACETASVRSDKYGKEIDGFAELAQRLGAGSVLATLWQVREGSTALIMKGFYFERQIEKSNKAEALRKSQLNLLFGRNGSQIRTSIRAGSAEEDIVVEAKYKHPFKIDQRGPFAHPYYWSPFVLFGNWK